MRLLPLLAIGAGLANAAPISVIVSSTEFSAFRLGHPAVHASSGIPRTAISAPCVVQQPSMMRRACHKMKSGANALFALIGIEPASADSNTMHANAPVHCPARAPGNEGVRIMPIYQNPRVKMWPKVMRPDAVKESDAVELQPEEGSVARPHGHNHHHLRPYHRAHGSFFRRVHRALMSLGPWEGRAVAFVIGCGIGVLLRMFWVMTVLLFRTIRGAEEEHDEDRSQFEQVIFVAPLDAEEIYVAPPEYTDEKVELAATDVKA